jgi:hypothetical protein
VLVAALVGTAPARAQETYLGTPMGGRSALMGNTGLALGVDGAAPFLNPASIANIDNTQLAFGANLYALTLVRSANWYKPGIIDNNAFAGLVPADQSFSSAGLTILPSAVCYFYSRPAPPGERPANYTPSDWEAVLEVFGAKDKIGLCLGITQQQRFALQTQSLAVPTSSGSFKRSEDLIRNWTKFDLGPAYSRRILPNLTIGASVVASVTLFDSLQTQSTFAVPNDGRPTTSSTLITSQSGWSGDVYGTIGVHWRFLKRYVLGASFRTPSIHVVDGYRSYYLEAASGDSTTLLNWQGSGGFRANTVPRLAIGLGVEFERLKLELDLFYHTPWPKMITADIEVQSTAITDGRIQSQSTQKLNFRYDARHVFDAAIGLEWFVLRKFSILAGFSTSFAGIEPLSANPVPGAPITSRQNQLSGSLGVGSYGVHGTLYVGAQVSVSYGQATSVNSLVLPPKLDLADFDSVRIIGVIAGSFNLRTFEQAVGQIGDWARGTEEVDETLPGEFERGAEDETPDGDVGGEDEDGAEDDEDLGPDEAATPKKPIAKPKPGADGTGDYDPLDDPRLNPAPAPPMKKPVPAPVQ